MSKALERKARRIAKCVARKIETCEERYDLSRSDVTGAFTSTVVNVLRGSLLLGATSLVAAGVSMAIADRIRSRRWSRREAEGTSSTLHVAEVEVSRVLQIMFIGGKCSGMEWVALALIEHRALFSFRWVFASANRATYEYLVYATRIEKRGLYSLLRSRIERDDSNTRTDSSIASYSSVAFDRHLVCYNRWDIDAAVTGRLSPDDRK